MKTAILDAGHGGVINGIYQTPGKRSPNGNNGVLYEGIFNRWVMYRVAEELDRLKIPYYLLTPEQNDFPLQFRSQEVNRIFSKNKKAYLVSIHANAGGGLGIEIFTSPGQTKSDVLASKFLHNLKTHLPKQKFREDFTDGDGDKEAKFWMLTKTKCPAVLLELGFMDNPIDYQNLWSKEYLNACVTAIVNTIKHQYYSKLS